MGVLDMAREKNEKGKNGMMADVRAEMVVFRTYARIDLLVRYSVCVGKMR